MTRHECEELILKKMMEIANIYQEYNAEGDYLSLTMFANQNKFDINNEYFGVDSNKPIQCFFKVTMDGVETFRTDED